MKKDDCIFCKIANGEIPSTTIFEDENFRVILDLNPVSKGHALILTKEHYDNVTQIPNDMGSKVLLVANKVWGAMEKGLGCNGFNVVMNTGESAGQTVFHFHTHIVPRYPDSNNKVTWESGASSPEELNEIAIKIRKELN